MRPLIVHSIILLITVTASFVLFEGPLQQYDLQIIALVFVSYVLLKKTTYFAAAFRLADALAATLIIGLVVNSTGGLSSPFFFLYYFLIFALSLLLEPVISLTTTLILVFLYLLTTPEHKNLVDYLPLFSLPFLTPLALFLGEQYRLAAYGREKMKDNQFFLALVVRKQINRLKELSENFLGDHELTEIKKTVDTMEKSLDQYEKNM